jgi:hypothetical protein
MPTKSWKKAFLEIQGELGISVRDHGLGQTMQFENFFLKNISNIYGLKSRLNRNKMSYLAKLIYYNHDCVMFLYRLW